MNGKRRSGSSIPNKGSGIPNLVRLTEAGLVLVFFMCVKALMVYFATYSAIQRVTACLMLSLPTRNDRKKSDG